MARLELEGDLATLLAQSFSSLSGNLVLSYGSSITGGGTNFYYTHLRGQFLTIPTTGPDAVTGSITSMGGSYWRIAEGAAGIDTVLDMTGISVGAADLFGLVRRMTTGVLVQFDAAALRQELNGQTWVIVGSDGRDQVVPTANMTLARADYINAGRGDDVISSGGGRDTLFGGIGNDSLAGGAGSDTLTGGAGDDRLSGGRHGDVFVFAGHFGHDRILGFEDGLDHIRLTGTRRVMDVGADTMIYVGDESIRLVGIDRDQISAADFL
jgi:Ca2+-binding RTX toxin-like protein